ncbi:MAG: radical SAM protein [Endomicrobiales bacterium]
MKPSEKLFEYTRRSRLPLLCTFELTRRCNLSCRHCYIDRAGEKERAEALSTAEVKAALRELARAGTLYLVFTGGEIFLRPDLIELCREARRLRFDLTLFSNGTLITEEHARMLSGLDVSGVEISLYGREETHEKVTGMRGSFARTVASLRLLRRHRVPVKVKSPLMTVNARDYPWLRSFAARLGARCRLDPTIAPRDNGNKDILRLRLDDARLRKIYGDPALFTPVAEKKILPGDEFFCSAGRNLVAIGCEGTVYPCLQLPLPLGNLRVSRWRKIVSNANPALSAYLDIRKEDISSCRSCGLSGLCPRCPGLALVENGNLRGPSRIACRIAKIMKKTLQKR